MNAEPPGLCGFGYLTFSCFSCSCSGVRTAVVVLLLLEAFVELTMFKLTWFGLVGAGSSGGRDIPVELTGVGVESI